MLGDGEGGSDLDGGRPVAVFVLGLGSGGDGPRGGRARPRRSRAAWDRCCLVCRVRVRVGLGVGEVCPGIGLGARAASRYRRRQTGHNTP
jgi:hypothetical protein